MNTNYPQDDENNIYVADHGQHINLAEIINLVSEKWPNIHLSDVIISQEHRHEKCLGYDLYDPTYYQNYIVISRQ